MGRYSRKLKRKLQRALKRMSRPQPPSSAQTTAYHRHADQIDRPNYQHRMPAQHYASSTHVMPDCIGVENKQNEPHSEEKPALWRRMVARIITKVTDEQVAPSNPFGQLSMDQTRGWIKMQGSKMGIAAINSYERSNKSIRTFLKKPLTKRQKRALLGVFTAIIALIVISVLVTSKMLDFSKDPSMFKAWADEQPILASIGFMFMMMVQIIIAFIPGEPLQILAGYGFGFWWGTAVCLLGSMIGSSIIFLGTKRYGTKLLFIFFSPEELEKLSFFNDPKRRNTLAFILMFIPGAPKDLISYVVGLTPMRLWTWLLISTTARSLGVVGSTIMGASVASNNHLVAIVIALIAIVCSLLGIMYYRNLVQKEEAKKLEQVAQETSAQTASAIAQAAITTAQSHAQHQPKQGIHGYAPFEKTPTAEDVHQVLEHLEEIAHDQEQQRFLTQQSGVLQRIVEHNPLRHRHTERPSSASTQPQDTTQIDAPENDFSVPIRSAKGISNDITGAIKIPKQSNDATGMWRMPK